MSRLIQWVAWMTCMEMLDNISPLDGFAAIIIGPYRSFLHSLGVQICSLELSPIQESGVSGIILDYQKT